MTAMAELERLRRRRGMFSPLNRSIEPGGWLTAANRDSKRLPVFGRNPTSRTIPGTHGEIAMQCEVSGSPNPVSNRFCGACGLHSRRRRRRLRPPPRRAIIGSRLGRS